MVLLPISTPWYGFEEGSHGIHNRRGKDTTPKTIGQSESPISELQWSGSGSLWFRVGIVRLWQIPFWGGAFVTHCVTFWYGFSILHTLCWPAEMQKYDSKGKTDYFK